MTRLHRFLSLAVLQLFAASIPALAQMEQPADPINYGDFFGNSVTFHGVTEQGSFTGDRPPPRLGVPTLLGNSLTFSPSTFHASATGAGIDGLGAANFADALLSFTITADPGSAITSVNFAATGSATMSGFGTDNTTVLAAAGTQIRIDGIDGIATNPIDVPVRLLPIPDGQYRLLTDGGGGPQFSRSWSGVNFIDLSAALIAQNIPFTRGVTSARVDFASLLFAASEEGTEANVSMRNPDGLRITPFTSPPAPPPRIEPPPIPPPPPAKNLVFVTHGWNRDSVDSFAWVDLMTDAIRADIEGNDQLEPDDWYVRGFHWEGYADTGITPFDGFDRARREGEKLGNMLGDIYAAKDYDHVHLIAHSAGSALINEIAKKIWAASPDTEIHMTFLDAYAPPWSDDYGAWTVDGFKGSATWADHYVTDFDLPATQGRLRNAHNFNITGIPEDGPLPLDVGHAYPHEFYRDTVLGIIPESDGTGYPLSLEGGDRDLSALRILYPHSRETFLGDPLRQIVQYGLELIADPFDFYAASHVLDGIVDLQGPELGMQTSSPVWYTAAVMIDEHYDVLRFDLDFTSDAGAEGLLAVYLDDELLWTIDERFAPDEPFENVFATELLSPGFHLLSFRLDPFTEVASAATVSNLRWGSLVAILPGDYNQDGFVNAADYTVWRDALGSTSDLRADGDRNGIIERDDYDIWKMNYGETLASNLGEQNTVPEPATLSLGIFALILVHCQRRTRP